MIHLKLFEAFKNEDFIDFLKDKKFSNGKTKMFLYHGTSIHPKKFNLRDDYEGEDGNLWGVDLPSGFFFLTTDLGEAKAYGQYVIPCELRKYDHIYFNVNANNPSQVFDDDMGISTVSHTGIKPGEIGMWSKFEESGKSTLIIKGTNKKWTVITETHNVIPRTDLAIEFYGS